MTDSPERENQTTRLRDGRRLGFAEYGPEDGSAAMLFGGASGRYLKPCGDDLLQRAGIRLIVVERPGFGLSDFQPKRTLLDWPDDVAQLADHLELERFTVIAGSQGGPYGAACGYKIPDRLTTLTLVSALATFDVPGLTEGMAPALALLLKLARYTPHVCSAVHPIGQASPFFRSLSLSSYGLEWVHPPAPLAHPLDDGSAVLVERSVDATAADLGVDAAVYRLAMGSLVDRWQEIIDDLLGPLRVPRHPLSFAGFGLGALLPASWLAGGLFGGERARAVFAGLASHRLPAGYARQLRRYRYGPGVFKLDLALDGPIPRRAAECLRAGTVHVGGTMAEIVASEAAAWAGRISQQPFVLVAQQSLFDPTRAPAGKQVVWAYCHVPHGSDVDMTPAIEGQIERFAPGFRDRILARTSRTAVQMEQYNPNYVGGDINGGVQDALQHFTRPAIRLSPYSTPNPSIIRDRLSTFRECQVG